LFGAFRWRYAVLGSVWFAVAAAVLAHSHVGTVVAVASGDTLTLRMANRTVLVRLAGIDAPEQGQPYGNRARKSLAMMTFGRRARVVATGDEHNGELVARLYVADVDVNAEMVRLGYAWAEREANPEFDLLRLEREAKERRRGLWVSDGHIAPWQWRAGKRSVERQPARVGAMVIADRNSKAFYLSSCPGAGQVLDRHRVLFRNREKAEASGYRLASNCR
jgi:micrococcal nuclease